MKTVDILHERIAALEAQVEDCEKEINHWKYEAESSKAMWDQLKVERDTLEAQVQTLREALEKARKMRDWFTHTMPEWDKSTQKAMDEFDAALAATEEKA